MRKNLFYKLLIVYSLMILVFYLIPVHPVVNFTAAFFLTVFFVYRHIGLEDRMSRKAYDDLREELREKGENIRLSNQQLQTIVSNLNFPFALISDKEEIINTNVLFLNLNNLESKKQFFISDLNDDLAVYLHRSFSEQQDSSRVLQFDEQDYRVSTIVVKENKRFYGLFVFAQNVTDIMEKERIQKRFIQDASHELKTPLSAILGMIEIINRNELDEVTNQDFNEQIAKEAKRMERIIQNMVKLSRISSQWQSVNRSVFNFHQLLSELSQSYQTEFERRNLRMIQYVNTKTMLWADRDLFYHIFSNLISNSVKYSQDGEIWIEAKRDSQFFTVIVEDFGEGIHPQDLPYIFNRYYRGMQKEEHNAQSSGLGLAIVKRYVELHQGNIEAESILGKGTRITIRFPSSIISAND